MSEKDAARELTEFLTKRDQYRRTSYLEERVQVEISTMAREIAAEVVKANPELKETITSLTRNVIRESLRRDTYLQETVVKAVSQALAQLVSERAE